MRDTKIELNYVYYIYSFVYIMVCLLVHNIGFNLHVHMNTIMYTI